MKRELNWWEVEQRERAPKKHGAYAYLQRSADGRPIDAEIALVQSQVTADLERDGPLALVERQALRFTVAAELLWAYMMGNEAQFKKGLHSWGWLAGAAVRSWERAEALRRAGDRGDLPAAKVLEALKGEQGE